MGIKTAIEYADSTVNAIMGCMGCELYNRDPKKNHCYAAALCRRYAGRKGWPEDFNSPEYFPGRLEKAIRWPDLTGIDRPEKPWLSGQPRVIFVNDLSDGFCPDVDAGGWLWPRLDAMEESPHIWLLLTKWPDRMREFFASIGGAPDNFWPGTSVLRQRDEWRIASLLKTRAKVHWVSCEPLLEEINLSRYLVCQAYAGKLKRPRPGTIGGKPYRVARILSCLDFVAYGGESGANARPTHPDHFRSLRDQLKTAGIPQLFKQWGAWKEIQFDKRERCDVRVSPYRGIIDRLPDPFSSDISRDEFKRVVAMSPVGKKAAGRLLDGKEWNEWPE